MHTKEERVDSLRAPHTDSVKPLSRMNPMRQATGGSPLHFFEEGKKAKMTLDVGGKSVSEKSQTTDLQEPFLEIKK
jgi:hypothetical protein